MASGTDHPRNPYIHEDPITDPDYFIGRENEVQRIEYELEQALAERPNYKNIAITGDKVSGKTSLSYKLESLAQDLDMETVRLRLNERSATNEELLFKEIIERTTAEISSKLHNDFLGVLHGAADTMEVDLKFVRFQLSSDGDGTNDAEVSEHMIRDDLSNIYNNADAPSITVILDNAEYLAESDLVLQKLKNIFTEIKGYNLVLVGSDDMFNNISSDMSSITRVFEKIELGPFNKYKHTKECITNPLQEGELGLLSEHTILEVHRLTGGRPYEINLLASYMYADYEINESSSLGISSNIINNVVDQLEEWRETVGTSVPDKIHRLDSLELVLLISTIEVPNIRFNWLIEYSRLRLYNSKTVTEIPERQEVVSSITQLIDKELIEDYNDELCFAGDAYSITYAKYLAISKGLISNFGGALQEPAEAFVANCHYSLIDANIVDAVQGSHSHYILSDLDEYDDSPRSVVQFDDVNHDSRGVDFALSESNHLSKGGDPLADRYLMVQPVDKDYKQSQLYPSKEDQDTSTQGYGWEKTVYLRIEIDCLDKGYTAVLHFEDPSVKSEIISSIEDHRGDFEDLGFDPYLENEHSLTEKAIEDWENGDYDAALEKFDQAIELDPENPLLWVNKSLLEYDNDPDEALECVDRALHIDDEFTDAHIHKGQLLISMGKDKPGMNHLEQAVNLSQENVNLLSWVSGNCGNLGYHGKEVKYAREALAIEPRNLHAKFHEVRGLYSLGEYEEVIKIVNDLVESEETNDSEHIYKSIGMKCSALIKLDRPGDAADTLQALFTEQIPDGIKRKLYSIYSKAHYMMGDNEKSLEMLNAALDERKVPGIDNTVLKVRKLHILIDSEEIDEAHRLSEELEGRVGEHQRSDTVAIEEEPVVEDKNVAPRFLYSVSRLWAIKEDGEKALSYLTRAVEYDDEYAQLAQEDPVFDNIRQQDHSAHIYSSIVN